MKINPTLCCNFEEKSNAAIKVKVKFKELIGLKTKCRAYFVLKNGALIVYLAVTIFAYLEWNTLTDKKVISDLKEALVVWKGNDLT